MARYRLEIKPSAVRELESLPTRKLRRLIIERIEALQDDPRPAGYEKLRGETGLRVRQGPHRIVYLVDDEGRAVTVMKIGHRRDVYR